MRRSKSLAFALIATMVIAPNAIGAGDSVRPLSEYAISPTDTTEAAIIKLQELAQQSGGLGVYKEASGWVLAKSSVGAEGFRTADVAALTIPVRVETQTVSPVDLESLGDALEKLHGRVEGSFGFGFDVALRKMVVQSEAPESDFAALEKAYPGLISYRPGKWGETASWSNDGQPHWGGAWLQGGGWACTSGYPIEDYSGHRYMLTAGHCFTNGTSTNMGTAVRPSTGDPWPYYDAELIKSHTYAGYVYVTGTGGDRVKNAANPGVGYHYCTTGRSSGFKCGWTIQNVNKTICFNNQPSCFHGLAGFTKSDGSIIQEGDSGGPLYVTYSDYTVGVRGTITGYFWDVLSFSYWSYATMYQPVADFYAMHAVIP